MEFINCTIAGSELAVSGDIPVMARGFAGIFAIKATFDSVWDDLTNHICSFKSKSGRPVSVLETDGYFTIPAEVSDAQWFDFAFTGMADDGRRITTNMVRITLKETILLGDEPEPLTPSISAQALTATEKLETRVEALEASSGGSVEIADGSITTAMLADYAVTSAKIKSSAITNDHIANSSISCEKLDPYTIQDTPLQDQIFRGDGVYATLMTIVCPVRSSMVLVDATIENGPSPFSLSSDKASFTWNETKWQKMQTVADGISVWERYE